MDRRRPARALLAVPVLVLGLVLGQSPLAGAAEDAAPETRTTCSLQDPALGCVTVPATAEPGETITITGTGWKKALDITFLGREVVSIRRSSIDSFKVRFRIPDDTSTGQTGFGVEGSIEHPDSHVSFTRTITLTASDRGSSRDFDDRHRDGDHRDGDHKDRDHDGDDC